MIYCVWYPSGGFGHFVNSILNSFGHNFVKPNRQAKVSADGKFHNQELVAPTYFHNQKHYQFDFDCDKNYSVLVDNGINNEGEDFRKVFPNAKIIKLCYSNWSWPVIAKTMIVKAMNSSIEHELPLKNNEWSTSDDWAVREKYFLFLRNHPLRHSWRPDNQDYVIFLEDLLDYEKLKNLLPVSVEDFQNHWQLWYQYNYKYFEPVVLSEKILQGDYVATDDLWTQAVLYYQIWCCFGIEVPHNDFSNWFENYQQIATMLKNHGVDIDSYKRFHRKKTS